MAEREERPPRALSVRRAFPSLSELQGEMERFWEGWPSLRFWRPLRLLEREEWLPAVDVYQKDGMVHVEAELPGMTEKDIEITVAEDTLTVSGEHKEEKEVKEEDYYRCERSYGHFLRQVALPAGVDADNAKASFKDGVLHVELPVKEAAKKKKIEISGAA